MATYLEVIQRKSKTEEPGFSNDDWSRPNTHTNWYFDGIRIVPEGNHYDEVADFDVVPGQEVYVVLVTYNTGDSFGMNFNNSVEFYGVYASYEKARAVEQLLRHYDFVTPRPTHYESESGTKISLYIPWEGMFGGLGEIRLESFRVE